MYAASDELMRSITGFAVHRGVLASFDRKPLPSVGEVVRGARRVVVLEDVNNHTNVGAIVRSASALGVDALLLDPNSCDPLYRRSLRISMGEALSLPQARTEALPAGLAPLRAAGFTLVALTPDAGAVDIADGRRRRARAPRPPARDGGRRALARRARGGRRARAHPAGGRRRLAQRGGRRGDRVLRPAARSASDRLARVETFSVAAIGRVASSRREPVDDDWDAVESAIELDAVVRRRGAAGPRGVQPHRGRLPLPPRRSRGGRRRTRAARATTRSGPRSASSPSAARAGPTASASRPAGCSPSTARACACSGLDAIDGTPVLDIKPYMREFGPRGEVRQPPWVDEIMGGYF